MNIEVAKLVNEALTAIEEAIAADHPLIGRLANPLIEHVRTKLNPEEAFVQRLTDRLLTKLGLLVVAAPPSVVAAMQPAPPVPAPAPVA